jgi:hypothetical protein
MGHRWWPRILYRMEVARIMHETSSKDQEYLSDKEWEVFQNHLSTAKLVCEELTHKYRLKLFRDSRWPATGIVERIRFKQRIIRLTLNPNYLENQKVFYELREHTVISFNMFYYKLISNNLLDTYTIDEIDNRDFINSRIESLIIKSS